VLVSDGGGKTDAEGMPKSDWPRHAFRAINLIQNQVLSLRKRTLIASFINGQRRGAYWGVTTDIDHYHLGDALSCPVTQNTGCEHGPGRRVVSPHPQAVLFRDGALGCHDRPVAYLQQLGLTKVGYHITSHYRSDHIGCAVEVLHERPLQHEAYDRGGSYQSGGY